MNLLLAGEVFAGYVLFAALASILGLALITHFFGIEDGSRFQCALDDADRARHVHDAGLAEDREVAGLDALYDLPSFVGLRSGWRG